MPWWGVLLTVIGSLLGGYVIGALVIIAWIRSCFDELTGHRK